jgi:hypothetical protein
MQELQDNPLVRGFRGPHLDPAGILDPDQPAWAAPVRGRRENVEPSAARQCDRPGPHAQIEHIALVDRVIRSASRNRAALTDIEDPHFTAIENRGCTAFLDVIENQRPASRNSATQHQPVIVGVDKPDFAISKKTIGMENASASLPCRGLWLWRGRLRGGFQRSTWALPFMGWMRGNHRAAAQTYRSGFPAPGSGIHAPHWKG